MCAENKIKVFKIGATEGIPTAEGIMKPFLFTENVSLIHLEIPAGMKVAPHAHSKEGILYCLKGNLEVSLVGNQFTINERTAIVTPANTEVGINNSSNAPVECFLISAPPTFKSAEELKERLKQHLLQQT